MSDESGFQVGRDAPEHYEAHVGRFMMPFVDALVSATVRTGLSVLDVACGTGFATRAAAAVAGREARVEGSDLNSAMVARARSVAEGLGLTIGWREASALELPYDDDSFDAVICQQGLQFFPDAAAGLAEMARVARHGGRVGVTVWAEPERSPFLRGQLQMLARHGGEGGVVFSGTEQGLRSWFNDAGLPGVSIESITVVVDLPPIHTYVGEQLKAVPWSAGFFALPKEQQRAALDELDAELAEYRTPDGVRVPFSSYLATVDVPDDR